MSPEFDDAIQQERAEQADAVYEAYFFDGSADAAFGRLPESVNEAYLAGYVAKLKELPTDANGRLIHYSPRQHFAYGYMDTPNPCRCDDEF